MKIDQPSLSCILLFVYGVRLLLQSFFSTSFLVERTIRQQVSLQQGFYGLVKQPARQGLYWRANDNVGDNDYDHDHDHDYINNNDNNNDNDNDYCHDQDHDYNNNKDNNNDHDDDHDHDYSNNDDKNNGNGNDNDDDNDNDHDDDDDHDQLMVIGLSGVQFGL